MSPFREPQLADYITDKKARPRLERLGVFTVDDLLRHFPRKYIFPGQATRFSDLEVGQDAVLYAYVESVRSERKYRRSERTTGRKTGGQKEILVTQIMLSDGYDRIPATVFNQKWELKKAPEGAMVLVTGKIDEFRGHKQLKNPKFMTQDGTEQFVPGAITQPVPIYPATAGLPSQKIQRMIRVLLATADDYFFRDIIPLAVRTEHDLPSLREALTYRHMPENAAEVDTAVHMFKFEEALALQAELASRRLRFESSTAVPLQGSIGGRLDTFDQGLPFTLTESQMRAGTEISRDLLKSHPMNRLLHGDVGSGKTLVALRSMLQAVDSGKQAALLAPTEVLAGQHAKSLHQLLGGQVDDGSLLGNPDGVTVTLLSGSMPAGQRKKAALDVASGQADIVVGTHALLSEQTQFADLGLIVVDEQHRFGVRQREQLRAKGSEAVPHTLVMTATPIPRTVAMTVFGDLDVSVLNEMPSGPKRIESFVVARGTHPRWMDRVYQVMAERIAAGQQIYVVVGRIDSRDEPAEPGALFSGHLPGIEETLESLRGNPVLEGARFGMLHGRMSAEEKDAAMTAFAAHQTDILVATTVIEVGVDVPNATCMVVLDAEMFGVAQLHQLRGRIGRDGGKAICFFVTARTEADPVVERLHTVAGTLDGFALAEFDLTQRKEGDVMGLSQSGLRSSLRYLEVIKDEDIVLAARADARHIVKLDPGLEQHEPLRSYVDRQILALSETWMEIS